MFLVVWGTVILLIVGGIFWIAVRAIRAMDRDDDRQ